MLSSLDSNLELLNAPADGADGVGESYDAGSGSGGLHVAETRSGQLGGSDGLNALEAGSDDPVGRNGGPEAEHLPDGFAGQCVDRSTATSTGTGMTTPSGARPTRKSSPCPRGPSSALRRGGRSTALLRRATTASRVRESGGPASRGSNGGGGGGPGAAAEEWTDEEEARYVWTRATLHCTMQDLGFSFSRGPNHYDIAREKLSVRKQRNNFTDTERQYRPAGRTIFYTDKTWLNKNMTSYRSWNDGTSNARLNVPSGKGGRIIVAHVGSRSVGLVEEASWVFIGNKKSADYHSQITSASWLQWLEESVLPKIRGGVLVIDRAPYHLVRNEAARPAASKRRMAEFADWLEKHDLVLPEWGPEWRTTCTRAVLKKRAYENRPRPR